MLTQYYSKPLCAVKRIYWILSLTPPYFFESGIDYNMSMRIGTRVVFSEELDTWDAEFFQISVYCGMKDNLTQMKHCARMCRERGIRYVIHPVNYYLLDREMMHALRIMAEWSDLALILHDEKTYEGKRLFGHHHSRFQEALDELSAVARVSFENARDTHDVRWFWHRYAASVTLDLGHVELAGINAVHFVRSLHQEEINKIDYVHMHRNNGWRNGLTDHWPLRPDCREVSALRELLKRRYDIGVILEINETEMTPESLSILRDLRDEAGI